MKVEYHVREIDAVKDQLKNVESEKQSKIEELEKALMSSQEEAGYLQTQFESCSKMIEERGIQLDGQIAKHATLLEQIYILQKVFQRDQELQSDLISKVKELEQLKRDHSSVVCELKQVKTENIKLKKHLKMFNKHVNVFSNNMSYLEPKPDELLKENQLLKSKIVAAQKLLDLSTFRPMMKNDMKSPEKVEGDFVDVVSEMDRLNVEQERDEIRFVV
uniref:Uncharacterized protein n=1 Tax=Panagrolaimus sp. JU765 TaxID=591449 RepID=A0AC34RQV0_9BILA